MNAYIEGDPDVRHYAVSTDFKLGRALGKGAFAKVVLGTSRKSKSLPIRAVKIIDVKALSQTDIDALDLEIKTMRRVAHHNIVGLYEIYSFADKFVMVLELCKGGELFDRIVVKEHYSETEARFSFAQMVEAIGHCHTKGVVHRDLKPENLLHSPPIPEPEPKAETKHNALRARRNARAIRVDASLDAPRGSFEWDSFQREASPQQGTRT